MRTTIITAIGLAFLMTSCMEKEVIDDFNNITPTPGKEIIFSAKLDTPQTKTVYGTETSTGIKVKWVHDDLVTVYGTTCSNKQAEYAVKTYVKDVNNNITEEILTSTPNTDTDGQNYADDLVKTGDAGVQWGNKQTSDFYAVYPSVSGDFVPTTEGDETTAVTVSTTISSEQYNSFSLVNNILKGTPFQTTNKTYGMDNAIMYAYTPDATPTDSDGNAKEVDLKFIPFSTVLQFTLDSWHGESDSDLESNETGKSIKVSSITLTAPAKIAGDFNLKLTGNVAAAEEGTSNQIVIVPSEEIVWTYGQKLEFSVFVIPVDGLTMSNDWKVTVAANDGSRTFSLKYTDADAAKIEPGKIHKVNVKGFPVYAPWEYDPATWLTTIPRNVYISDISLPGAWYATDSGYQDGTLAEQYAAGIRAFNIDCRLTLAAGEDVNDYDTVTENQYYDNESHVTDGTLVLSCAGTEVHKTFLAIPDGKISSIGKTVKQAIVDLGELLIGNTEEYIEVILTVSQKPKDYDYLNTSYFAYGTVNAKMMLAAITQVLNDSEVKPYLYGYNTGEIITPNTTIGDVAGKVVVKVNMNTSADNIRKWGYAAPMLVSEASMAPSAGTATNYITAGSFAKMNSSEMYWSNNYITDDTDPGYMMYHYHQCQNTNGTSPNPDVPAREAAIQNILDESYSIYSNNTHDAMFQLGIGGWTSDSSSGKTNLSSQLNPYVYGIINSMLTGATYPTENGKVYTPAPVGAVLMNFATAGTSVDKDVRDTKKLIKAIIDLNGKYFLNRDITKPAWPSDQGGSDDGNQEEEDGSGTSTGGGSEGNQEEV